MALRQRRADRARQYCHKADRRSRFTLCKSRDDAESIGLDRVVGDAGYIAEIDAQALDRPQAVSVCGPE
jgi:hypothetical protein